MGAAMALRDWAAATATAATVATVRGYIPPGVAVVATDDVADPADEGNRPPVATPKQAGELGGPIAQNLASNTDADKAQALSVALADPEASLTSFPALATEFRHTMRAHAPARKAGDDRQSCDPSRQRRERYARAHALAREGLAWKREKYARARTRAHSPPETQTHGDSEMSATPELPLTATEQLELRVLVVKLQADLARFGDRWARRQPRAKGTPPDAAARLAALQALFANVLRSQ
jgi:hypothetical protein